MVFCHLFNIWSWYLIQTILNFIKSILSIDSNSFLCIFISPSSRTFLFERLRSYVYFCYIIFDEVAILFKKNESSEILWQHQWGFAEWKKYFCKNWRHCLFISIYSGAKCLSDELSLEYRSSSLMQSYVFNVHFVISDFCDEAEVIICKSIYFSNTLLILIIFRTSSKIFLIETDQSSGIRPFK